MIIDVSFSSGCHYKLLQKVPSNKFCFLTFGSMVHRDKLHRKDLPEAAAFLDKFVLEARRAGTVGGGRNWHGDDHLVFDSYWFENINQD